MRNGCASLASPAGACDLGDPGAPSFSSGRAEILRGRVLLYARTRRSEWRSTRSLTVGARYRGRPGGSFAGAARSASASNAVHRAGLSTPELRGRLGPFGWDCRRVDPRKIRSASDGIRRDTARVREGGRDVEDHSLGGRRFTPTGPTTRDATDAPGSRSVRVSAPLAEEQRRVRKKPVGRVPAGLDGPPRRAVVRRRTREWARSAIEGRRRPLSRWTTNHAYRPDHT